MKAEQGAVEKIEYVSYQELANPEYSTLSQQIIDLGFESKEWFVQFQTITSLRQANRYYANIFLNQLLPKNCKNIIGQVQNLRSNNSKEALTLISEIFEHQTLKDIDSQVIRPIVSAIFIKSVSQKGFLKSQALKAISFIPKKWNPFILQELCVQTQSQNGNISELAIKTMKQMIENNKEYETDSKFLKNLSGNINGKRAVLQKQAKQILKCLKATNGEEKLEQIITQSTDLLQEESNTLRKQLKKEATEKDTKSNQSIKDFLKAKKEGK